MKLVHTIVFIVCSMLCVAQQTERITVQGEVVVTNEQDKELVAIYNTSSERGTTTDANGKFTLDVALHDRVSITAIQFQTFTVVIDKNIIDTKVMKIYLNPYVNKLDEVFLSNYNLSGILEYDAENIEVIEAPKIALSFDADADFAPDRFSRIEGNVAEEAMGIKYMANGINIAGIIELLAKALFPSKEKQSYPDLNRENASIVKLLQQKYTAAFYSETFKIPLDRVDDFIYFVGEGKVTYNLLQPENEMDLLEVLFQQSDVYTTRSNGE